MTDGAFDHLAKAAMDLGVAKAKSEHHLALTMSILRRFVADHASDGDKCGCTLCKDARQLFKEYEARP
jgi:hypothetical protein